MRYGRVWIVLLVECPAATIYFLLRDANARTGRRIGEKGCKIIGAYGRNARPSDSNGTSLLRFASDNKLAHVKHVLLRPEGIHVSYIQWYLVHG